jgi:hypothetical protein
MKHPWVFNKTSNPAYVKSEKNKASSKLDIKPL